MKNILIGVGLVLLVGVVVANFVPVGNFGISSNQVDINDLSNVTSTRITCGVATTTVLAVQPARTSFMAQNVGTSTVFLCRNNTFCSASSGIALFATSSLEIGGNREKYEQFDGYKGQYTCHSPLTAPLNIWHSQ